MSPGGANALTSPTLSSLRPTRLRSAVDQLLMLATLDDTEPAPGDVIENPGDL
jgi:hypothetical protein